jgi:hypothetical protein
MDPLGNIDLNTLYITILYLNAYHKYSHFDVQFVVYHLVYLEVFNFNYRPFIYTLYIHKTYPYLNQN